jgi:KTSC domain
MRAAEILLELGNSPVEYEVTERTPDIYVVESPEIGLKLFFSRVIEKGMDDVQIEFSVHGRYDLAKSGNAIKVFTTVKNIFETELLNFIQHTDELIEFAAERKEPSRVSLYLRMVPMISKILGPQWEFIDEDMGHSIRIYRWKRVKKPLTEKPVESTWITDLVYNRPNKVLTMRLSNGVSYSIPNITRTTFDQWTKTPSKGQFFHDRIKDKFNIKRI